MELQIENSLMTTGCMRQTPTETNLPSPETTLNDTTVGRGKTSQAFPAVATFFQADKPQTAQTPSCTSACHLHAISRITEEMRSSVCN
jgi:hypothetical protein